MPEPPAFNSAEIAREMIELYWQALTRDVPFAEYDSPALPNAAVADLSKCTAFRGPKVNGEVTTGTLFRGDTIGDLTGPYLSHFLWLDVPFGVMTLAQRGRLPVACTLNFSQIFPRISIHHSRKLIGLREEVNRFFLRFHAVFAFAGVNHQLKRR